MSAVAGFDIKRLAVPCCWIRGVPIRVHLLLPLVTVLAALGAWAAGSGWVGVVLAIVLSGPLLFATVLVHELGHVFAARRCGLQCDHILLWPLGGLAMIGSGASGPKNQIFISAAGPLTHLPMIGFWLIFIPVFGMGRFSLNLTGFYLPQDFMAIMCIQMVITNIVMLAFNLLVPCFPLDCSQILLSILLLCGMDGPNAARVIVYCSVPIIVLLLAYGIWAYVAGNAYALLVCFTAVWLFFQTYQLHTARVRGELSQHPLFASISGEPSQRQEQPSGIWTQPPRSSTTSASAFPATSWSTSVGPNWTGTAPGVGVVLGKANPDKTNPEKGASTAQFAAGTLLAVVATVLAVVQTTRREDRLVSF